MPAFFRLAVAERDPCSGQLSGVFVAAYRLRREGVIDQREHKAITRAARQSGIGEPGQTEGYRTIFDGSTGSFAKWQHVGGGSFGLNPDGSMRLRCDSAGRRSAPLINDEFDVPADEVILDRASV